MIIVQQDGTISRYGHICLIYNPCAGGLRGSRARKLAQAEQVLRGYGHRISLIPTTAPRTAGELARQCIAQGADLIVTAGGDGTVNEVAEGMMGSPVPLGILPAGTANVLAHELGLHRSLAQAAHKLAHCQARRVPMGRLRFASGKIHHFLLMAGAGLDAHIVFHLNLRWKARWGKMAYWASGAREFGRSLEEFRVVVNGQEHECSFALVSKVRNYGGDFRIARNVSLLDDEFEVVLFRGRNPYRYMLYLAALAVQSHHRIDGVAMYRAKEVELLPRPGEQIHLQVDGEYAGLLPASISTVAEGVQLLIPSPYGQ